MTRRKIIAGNWKMYKTRDEALALVSDILPAVRDIKDREVALFVPAVHAHEVSSLCAGVIDTGMQNIYFEKEGAFTGEISPVMARDCGCRYTLVGHSERRNIFGESDILVNKKMVSALNFGLEPVICVGELPVEYELGLSKEVCCRQIVEGLAGITAEQMSSVLVSYEPIWAIGTGKVATPDVIGGMHAAIRNAIAGLFGAETAKKVPILYGGSVKPDNAAGILAVNDVDGVLVGGASLKVDSFLSIARS
jgi:triosephosphate isomerase